MFKIAKQWITEAGLKAIVLPTDSGSFNGYVGLPNTHTLYKKDYYENPDLMGLAVHGGVTFSDFIPKAGEEWFIGFDTMHSGDAPSIDVVRKYFTDKEVVNFKRRRHLFHGTHKDLAYVMNECEELAKQLTERD